MKPIRIAVCALLIATAAMSETPNIQRNYDAAKDQSVYILTAVDLRKESNGEFDLSAMLYFSGAEITAPATRAVLAVLWIGLERKFSTPAVVAVELGGEQVFMTAGSHHAEVDGNTVDESVYTDVDVDLLRKMSESDRVVVRVDELRFPLEEIHRQRLRELLRLNAAAP